MDEHEIIMHSIFMYLSKDMLLPFWNHDDLIYSSLD